MAEKSVDDRALDVATQVLHHIDTMYPGMWKDVPASARTSLWNTIISAVNVRFRPAVETDARQWMRISYETRGRCMWHEDCDKSRSGVMREVLREESRTLLECLSCGRRGYYPVGAVGPVCVAVETAALSTSEGTCTCPPHLDPLGCVAKTCPRAIAAR